MLCLGVTGGLSFCPTTALATVTQQTIKVTGQVVDQDGEPLIGATVRVKGSQTGSVTDFDGNFTIDAPANATLVVSYVGYKDREIAVNGRAVIETIQLESDSQILDQVVVVGYGTQKKADLTGSVSIVNAEEMKRVSNSNISTMLEGKVAGVQITSDGQPGADPAVRIRGIGSFGSTAPLYVIDGVPMGTTIRDFSPNDIETIQVLKDASAGAIYGSRAANGVIIITTKKGKDGRIKVNFDGSVATSFYTNKIETMNASEWGRAFWQASVNDGLDPNNNNLGYNYDWSYDALGHPVLSGMTMDMFLDENATVRTGDTDWFKEITRTGVVQQYNLSVSNGGEKGNAFFSMGYYDNQGTIKDSYFNRLSARANADYKLIDGKVVLGENFTINRTKGVDAPGGVLEHALEFNPNFPIRAENGKYAQALGAYSERENPLSMISNAKDNEYTQWRMFGDVHLSVTPLKNFMVRTTLGMDYTRRSSDSSPIPLPTVR